MGIEFGVCTRCGKGPLEDNHELSYTLELEQTIEDNVLVKIKWKCKCGYINVR